MDGGGGISEDQEGQAMLCRHETASHTKCRLCGWHVTGHTAVREEKRRGSEWRQARAGEAVGRWPAKTKVRLNQRGPGQHAQSCSTDPSVRTSSKVHHVKAVRAKQNALQKHPRHTHHNTAEFSARLPSISPSPNTSTSSTRSINNTGVGV